MGTSRIIGAYPASARQTSERLLGGWVSAVDCEGRRIWIADAHRDHGKRFVVRADEKLTAFLELQRAIHGFAVTVSQES